MTTAINNQYAVIASFRELNTDAILGYFDTLEEAKKYEQELLHNKTLCNIDSGYNQIKSTSIYQLKGISDDNTLCNE